MLFCPFSKLIQEIRHEGSGIAFWCSHVSVACGFLETHQQCLHFGFDCLILLYCEVCLEARYGARNRVC